MAKKSAKKKSVKKSATKKSPPPRRTCGTMQAHFRLLEQDPSFRQRQFNLQQFTAQQMMFAAAAVAKAGPTIIPVVVHVVYNKAAGNISDAQIKSQIPILNRDFRARNTDKSKTPAVWKGLIADANVEFALATKDPKGQPTSGITRTKTSKTEFVDDDTVKFKSSGGQNAWPRSKYLNLWICELGNYLLGYAQFPGGPAATDGVVVTHTAFGTSGTAEAPFNKGRTATHEIGHWLNLRHIWGDTEDCSGTDLVADTPNAAGPNYGKPAFPSISCNNGPNGDMFMNYMDYVDDAAMFMFTSQQVARIAATLKSARSAF
ncbi:MAG: hypothetical protein QOF02_2815 [Blastocatellia bacterium]|jgi:hypothetical protein|nr:hypothetical protein [Blastocatellia bacterium]